MSEYRFHLQKYKVGNRYTCPQCGRKRCFARYIDEQGHITFPDNVGRCDHEQSCGYHYSPSDYFKDNPDANYKETEGFLSYEFLSSNGDSYIGKQMKLSYIQQISNIAFLSNDKLHLVLSKDGLKALQELLKIGTRIEIKGFAGIKELEVTTYEDNEKFFIPLDKAAEHDFALYTSFRTMRYLHKCFSMSNGSLYLCVSNDCIYKPIYGIKLDTNSGDLIYCACEGAVERFDEPLYSAMP